MNSSAIGKCYFFDVGQGSAHAICIGTDVIVVDCGYTGSEVYRLLQDRCIDTVKHLVLSHNDSDHARGLLQLLSKFQGRVENIWLLGDYDIGKSNPSAEARRRLYQTVLDNLTNGKIGNLYYLHTTQVPIVSLYSNAQVALELIYPGASDNLKAILSSDPNLTSGVLRLQCGQNSIIFAGDAPLAAWEQIKNRHGKVHCDILAGPHHAGNILSKESDDFEKLYKDYLNCKHVVVSVGTGNSYDHPLPKHISAIRDSGANVMCTQITQRCCPDPSKLPNPILSPVAGCPQRSAPRPDGASSGVACAGTITVELTTDLPLNIERSIVHRTRVNELSRTIIASDPREIRRPVCIVS